jgi:hypothetical protein
VNMYKRYIRSEEREVIDKAVLVGAKECLYRDDQRCLVSTNKVSIRAGPKLFLLRSQHCIDQSSL